MKRFLVFCLALCVALSCVVFTACTHSHSFDGEWITDENNHWKECTGENCTAQSDFGAHTYDDGVCSVCGKQESAIYEVTDTEWNNAFAFGNNVKVVEKQTFNDGSYTTNTINFAQNGICVSTQLSSSSNYDQFNYIEFDNDVVYSYHPVRDPDSGVILGHKREQQDITVTEYVASFGSCSIGELGDKTKYTYNATTKAYELATLTIGEGYRQVVYSNISIKFKNGALLSFNYSATNGNGYSYTGEYTITRDAVINFPSLYIERTIADEIEWGNALSLMTDHATAVATINFEGQTNTATMKMQLKDDGTRMVYAKNPVENDTYEESYFKLDYSGYSTSIYEYQLHQESNLYFAIESDSMTFMQVTEEFFIDAPMIDFEFIDGSYYAEYSTITGLVVTDVYLTFADGKIEKAQFKMTTSGNTYNCEVNYDYSPVTVDAPQNTIDFNEFVEDYNTLTNVTKKYYAKQYASWEYELLSVQKNVGEMKIYESLGSVDYKTKSIFVIEGGKYYMGFAFDVPVEEDYPVITVKEKTQYKYNQDYNSSGYNLTIREDYMPDITTLTYNALTNTFTDEGGSSIKLVDGKIVELIRVDDGYFKYTIDYTTPIFDQEYVIG